MVDYTAMADAENTILLTLTNTSPASVRKFVKRVDDVPRGARVIMTLTKNEAGVLFWTLQEIGRVER